MKLCLILLGKLDFINPNFYLLAIINLNFTIDQY